MIRRAIVPLLLAMTLLASFVPLNPGVTNAQGPTPMLALNADVTVHSWPDDDASVLGTMPAQSSVVTDGRLEDSSWWQIPFPGAPDGNGWIPGAAVTPNEAAPTVPTYVIILPTPEPMATPIPTPNACVYNAAFVADVTIPDGTVVSPAQPINKVWRIRNTGTCAWDGGTVLDFVGGSLMSAAPTAAFRSTAPGETTDIGVTFYAPSESGVYRSVWQLESPTGTPFGPKITAVVHVPAPSTPPTPVPPPPAPTAVPQPSISFWSDTNKVNAGDCTKLHWDVNHVQAVYLEYGGKTRGVTGQGSKTVCPSNDGNVYTLHVMMADGSQHNRVIQINVSVPGVKIDFHPNHDKIVIGQCVTLNWKVSNASRVRLNVGDGWEDVASQSHRQVCPAYPATYHMKVTDLSGNNHDRSVSIKVNPPPLLPTPKKKK